VRSAQLAQDSRRRESACDVHAGRVGPDDWGSSAVIDFARDLSRFGVFRNDRTLKQYGV